MEIFKHYCFMSRLLLREWMCMQNPGMIGHVCLFYSLVSWVAFGVLTFLWLCISMCLLKGLCGLCVSTNGKHLNWYLQFVFVVNYKVLNFVGRGYLGFLMERDVSLSCSIPILWDRVCPKASRLGHWDASGTALSRHMGWYLISVPPRMSRRDLNPWSINYLISE